MTTKNDFIDMNRLRDHIAGSCHRFSTPFGERLMLYADYMASGRHLDYIENYLSALSESYANTHTEDSYSGRRTTELCEKASTIIKQAFNADESYSLITVGSGSTSAIVKVQEILGVRCPPATLERFDEMFGLGIGPNKGVADGSHLAGFPLEHLPVVFVGPYEHHSNVVSWRESIAEVVEIDLDESGFLDLADLRKKVSNSRYDGRIKIGSFSAASNVTGLVTPIYEVAEILHDHGSLALFDVAASAPYKNIDMMRNEKSYIDAIYISPHKFVGGPGSSGLLLLKNSIYRRDLPPTCGGGGVVDYVGPDSHDYTSSIETREAAGTPGIIQLMRAALAIDLKEKLGVEFIEKIEERYAEKAMSFFGKLPDIDILGVNDPKSRIAVVSFNIKHGDKVVHPKIVTTLLNDLFGIQSRAGCSCAGPYGHRLLGIGAELSDRYRCEVGQGYLGIKPGWARVGFHYTMAEYEVDFVLDAIRFVAENASKLIPLYEMDLRSGEWSHRGAPHPVAPEFGIEAAISTPFEAKKCLDEEEKRSAFGSYMKSAEELVQNLSIPEESLWKKLPGELEAIRFFNVVYFKGA